MKLRENLRTQNIRQRHAKGVPLPLNLDAYERQKHDLADEIETKIVSFPEEFTVSFDPYEGKWIVAGMCKDYLSYPKGLCCSQNWCVWFHDDELASPLDVLNKIKDEHDIVESNVRRMVEAVKKEFQKEIIGKVFER